MKANIFHHGPVVVDIRLMEIRPSDHQPPSPGIEKLMAHFDSISRNVTLTVKSFRDIFVSLRHVELIIPKNPEQYSKRWVTRTSSGQVPFVCDALHSLWIFNFIPCSSLKTWRVMWKIAAYCVTRSADKPSDFAFSLLLLPSTDGVNNKLNGQICMNWSQHQQPVMRASKYEYIPRDVAK